MNTIIDRSHLTDLLLDTLQPEEGETRQWEVGDHEKPKEGGWQGEPGRSNWVPYYVLTATPSRTPEGSLGSPGEDVWFGYSVTSVSRSRRGVEKASVVARERFGTLRRTKTADGRTISRVQVTRYGGNERLATEPPLYLVTDQFTVYTTS